MDVADRGVIPNYIVTVPESAVAPQSEVTEHGIVALCGVHVATFLHLRRTLE